MNKVWTIASSIAALMLGIIIGYLLPQVDGVPLLGQKPAVTPNKVMAGDPIPIDLSSEVLASAENNITAQEPQQTSFTQEILTGRGQQASKIITLPGGGYRITMTHNGTSNFIVVLKDGQGKQVELLTNQVGKATTSQVINLPSGSYLFNIGADGDWTIKVEAL